LIYVLDSSAVLAVYNRETGSDKVRGAQGRRLISAVNFSEIESKLIERGVSPEAIAQLENMLPCEVIAFDRVQASLTAKLRRLTKHKSLSLGDRACLALAIQQKATVLTADRAWMEINAGVKIEVVR
jgi:ribonuclease VapC